MQSEELVEAAARRMAVVDGQNPDKLSHNSFEWWRHYVPMARAALEAALTAAEPMAAMTTDYLGCEYVSMDVAGIENIAATHSKGPTKVVYLYAAPPAPSVAVKALEWIVEHPEESNALVWDVAKNALSAQVQGVAGLPQDVIDLVIAAREFWDIHNDMERESKALDRALENFASRVPYEDETRSLPAAPAKQEG